jgi:hypothetical protein
MLRCWIATSTLAVISDDREAAAGSVDDILAGDDFS